MMLERKKKVILVGAKGYQQTGEGISVECFHWNEITKIRNVRDYDTVVINLLPLEDQKQLEKIEWDRFHELLDFDGARDILQHEGAIILVGDPRFDTPRATDEKKDERITASKQITEVTAIRTFLEWTGLLLQWDSQPGDTVQFLDNYEHRMYLDYVSRLKSWDYSLTMCQVDHAKLREYWNIDYLEKENMKVIVRRDYFSLNRYNNALAFAVRYEIVKKGSGNYSDTTVNSFGPIIFLPRISLNEDETIQLILKDICGVQASLPEPDWLSDFTAPGQKGVDEEITRVRGELENIYERLRKAQEKQEECRLCLKLLYEREYALEPIVRKILRGLGAHVEDPEEDNKEDGWIVVKVGDETHEGVIEIKSTKGNQFSEEGRKQLLDWIDRGRTIREKNYKGIFIGNSAVDKPVDNRTWAFSDSWMKAAKLSGICAMKTEDLYVIHLLNSRGLIDMDKFWIELFEANGIFDMKRYWELLAPKDEKTSESKEIE